MVLLLQLNLHSEYVNSFVGTVAEVLFERCVGDNIYEGHMSNYITVRAESPDDISHTFKQIKVISSEKGVAIGMLQ